MLERLSVENYALIRKLDLDLSPSLNIITGETGAGKSILLGALGLILGNRSDTGALKDESRNCVIEGNFDLEGYDLQHFFEANGLEYDRHTIIRRIIAPSGKSRAYVNDIPVQLATLKELSSHLIDIHSQNQSVLVADEGFRIRVIDSLAANSPLRAEYAGAYRSLREKERELARLREESERVKLEESYIRAQWERLSALGLREGEQERLETEQTQLANAGAILSALATAVNLMEEENTGILASLKTASDEMSKIGKVLKEAGELGERIRSVYVELKDVDAETASLAGRIESDPMRLEAVESRLGAIYELMRRHGVSSGDELLAIESNLREQLDSITVAGDSIKALEADVAALQESASSLADRISEGRKSAAERFDTAVERVLARLGMASALFQTEITPAGALSSTGGDKVRFLFNANRQGKLQPLEKVASGGETSRVMLALKSIVARSAMLPTIIFDEIDTGVSGRIADVTGDIIAELGETMQVVNITHLPQVASKGDTHFLVYKEETTSGNVTRMRLLGPQERVQEIAKMLSGSTVTPAAVLQAETLLGYGG